MRLILTLGLRISAGARPKLDYNAIVLGSGAFQINGDLDVPQGHLTDLHAVLALCAGPLMALTSTVIPRSQLCTAPRLKILELHPVQHRCESLQNRFQSHTLQNRRR